MLWPPTRSALPVDPKESSLNRRAESGASGNSGTVSLADLRVCLMRQREPICSLPDWRLVVHRPGPTVAVHAHGKHVDEVCQPMLQPRQLHGSALHT
jgi:hypothetical protein